MALSDREQKLLEQMEMLLLLLLFTIHMMELIGRQGLVLQARRVEQEEQLLTMVHDG